MELPRRPAPETRYIDATEPRVTVVGGLGAGDTTIVFVYGEHDYGSRAVLEDALAGIDGPVLVDLAWCDFVDTAVVSVIFAAHTRLARAGHELELIVPANHEHIARRLQVLHADSVVVVHESLPGELRG